VKRTFERKARTHQRLGGWGVRRAFASVMAGACLLFVIPLVSQSSATAASPTVNPCVAAKNCKVGYIVASAVPALVSMGQGVLTESTHLGMAFTEQSIALDPNQQLSAMSAMISQGVNVIITSPLVVASFGTAITQANNAGIPVLTYDGGVEPGVTMNIANADQAAAQQMVGIVANRLKKLHKACNLGLVDGPSFIPALGARDTGMANGAKANHCKVLSTQVNTNDTLTGAAVIAHQWASQFGQKMTAVISYNDNAEMGVVSATNKKWSPLLTSYNGESPNLTELKAGRVYADLALQNAVMGEGLAYGAYLTLEGQTVPSQVNSPYVLLTKSNVAKYRADAAILQLPVGKLSFVTSGNSVNLVDSASRS
jgi:ABC-type sugar transport system substrate-binding protein